MSLNTTGPAKTNQPETVEKEIKYIRDLGAVYHKEEQAEKIITATMERFEEVRQKVKRAKIAESHDSGLAFLNDFLWKK